MSVIVLSFQSKVLTDFGQCGTCPSSNDKSNPRERSLMNEGIVIMEVAGGHAPGSHPNPDRFVALAPKADDAGSLSEMTGGHHFGGSLRSLQPELMQQSIREPTFDSSNPPLPSSSSHAGSLPSPSLLSRPEEEPSRFSDDLQEAQKVILATRTQKRLSCGQRFWRFITGCCKSNCCCCCGDDDYDDDSDDGTSLDRRAAKFTADEPSFDARFRKSMAKKSLKPSLLDEDDMPDIQIDDDSGDQEAQKVIIL